MNGFALNFGLHTQDNEVIGCHRAVLFAMCKGFRQMCDKSDDGHFDVDMKYLIMNTTRETVEHLMQLLYTGRVDIHDDNVEAILTQSSKLQLHELVQHCLKLQ